MHYYLMSLAGAPKLTLASGYTTDSFHYEFKGGRQEAEIILIEKSDIIAKRENTTSVYSSGSLVTLTYDIPGIYTSSDGAQQHISVGFAVDAIKRLEPREVVEFSNLKTAKYGAGLKPEAPPQIILPDVISPDEDMAKWRGHLSRIIAEHSIISLASPLKTASLLYELLYELTEYSLMKARSHGSDPINGASKYYKAAVSYISTHLHDLLYVGDIADAVKVSYGYLNRIFKHECGESVLDYINHARITRVCEILRTKNLKADEICPLVGFSDVKYLSRLFKKYTGVTMSGYRDFWTRKQ